MYVSNLVCYIHVSFIGEKVFPTGSYTCTCTVYTMYVSNSKLNVHIHSCTCACTFEIGV